MEGHTCFSSQYNYPPSCSDGQNGRHSDNTADNAWPSPAALSYMCDTSCTVGCVHHSLHTGPMQTGYPTKEKNNHKTLVTHMYMRVDFKNKHTGLSE